MIESALEIYTVEYLTDLQTYLDVSRTLQHTAFAVIIMLAKGSSRTELAVTVPRQPICVARGNSHHSTRLSGLVCATNIAAIGLAVTHVYCRAHVHHILTEL